MTFGIKWRKSINCLLLNKKSSFIVWLKRTNFECKSIQTLFLLSFIHSSITQYKKPHKHTHIQVKQYYYQSFRRRCSQYTICGRARSVSLSWACCHPCWQAPTGFARTMAAGGGHRTRRSRVECGACAEQPEPRHRPWSYLWKKNNEIIKWGKKINQLWVIHFKFKYKSLKINELGKTPYSIKVHLA